MPEITPRLPEQPSAIPAPEKQGEAIEFGRPEKLPQPATEKISEAVPLPQFPVANVPTTAPTRELSPLQKKIEEVLEEGLENIYKELNAQEQEKFKIKGEETAEKISVLLQKIKVKMSEILKLVRDWLLTIPGINKYFLEQEAKIKADKIFKIRT